MCVCVVAAGLRVSGVQVLAVAINAEGTLLASGSRDRTVIVWVCSQRVCVCALQQ